MVEVLDLHTSPPTHLPTLESRRNTSTFSLLVPLLAFVLNLRINWEQRQPELYHELLLFSFSFPDTSHSREKAAAAQRKDAPEPLRSRT